MDTNPPAREPVTYHADSHGGFYTTSLFWDCSCDDHYIHPFTEPDCPACGTGTLTVMIKQAHPAADVTGVDGDPVVLAVARKKSRAGRREHYIGQRAGF